VNIQVGQAVSIRGWRGVAFHVLEVTGDRRVKAVMVGDNRVHHEDIEDCTPLKDDEYCSECGQIGCGHGRTE
jgi:hypothetical protein